MLYGWGLNEAGQTGAGNTGVKNILIPQRIGERTDWKCVAAGSSHSYAIDDNGDLWGVGENTHGGLANGVSSEVNTFVLTCIDSANIDGKWSFVDAGDCNGIGIKEDGSLWTWGRNKYGTLGLGDTVDRGVPEQIGSGKKWIKAVINQYAAAALTEDGDFYIWGDNRYQLLTPTGIAPATDMSPVPGRVDFCGKKWSDISVGHRQAMAIEAETGDLYIWGTGVDGQLGLGSAITKDLAVPQKINIPDGSRCIKINAGEMGSGAIVQDKNGNRVLFRWGQDVCGEVIGDGGAAGQVLRDVS